MNILTLCPGRFGVVIFLLIPFLTVTLLTPALAQRGGSRNDNSIAQRQQPQRQRVSKQQRQPVSNYRYAANVCPPAYSAVNNYNPYVYDDFYDRRAYRRSYRRRCSVPFLVLGFFLSRPYSNYNAYAQADYNQSYFYGDDAAYQPSPVAVADVGGQLPSAPNLETAEGQMLTSLSRYVDNHTTVEGSYQLADSAFGNEVWNLELAQAPAVFEIQDGLYSVVAGFEGTLGANPVPSNVNVEFFVAKTATGYEVRDSWITSANGITRNKLYQSPVYPDVSTWEADRTCPFTGQPMVPTPAQTSDHG